jgi:ketosteroid isomerase-like protein
MDPHDDILRLALARAHALVAGDGPKLVELLHEDFVWTTHRGEVFDRAEYVGRNTGGDTVWRSQQLNCVRVRVVDRTAVLVAEVVDVVDSKDGAPETSQMPITQTWVRVGESWQCLAGHAGPRRTVVDM